MQLQLIVRMEKITVTCEKLLENNNAMTRRVTKLAIQYNSMAIVELNDTGILGLANNWWFAWKLQGA